MRFSSLDEDAASTLRATSNKLETLLLRWVRTGILRRHVKHSRDFCDAGESLHTKLSQSNRSDRIAHGTRHLGSGYGLSVLRMELGPDPLSVPKYLACLEVAASCGAARVRTRRPQRPAQHFCVALRKTH